MQPETATTQSALVYYARHQAALFPIPYGQKKPFGIVNSFMHDFSRDPAQWQTWRASFPRCNFGVVACHSGWIICDIDVTGPAGREGAWAAWCELCTSWGLPGPLQPHTQSARGGWHVYLAVPPGVDATTLTQPDAVKKIINIRVRGFTVTAGSYYDGTSEGKESGPYILLSDTPPYPAPTALVEYCSPGPTGTATGVGTRYTPDIEALIKWMAAADLFLSYEDWIGAGMALKIELGDAAGLPIWRHAHLDDGKDKSEASHWASFASEPGPGVQTLNTLMKRAHAAGWTGSVRSTVGLEAVADMASAAGATLTPSATSDGISLAARAKMQAEKYLPAIESFLSATAGEPSRPGGNLDHPTMPPGESHPLWVPLDAAIARVFAMAESPKSWNADRVKDVLAVLYATHADVGKSVLTRLQQIGAKVNTRQIKQAGEGLVSEVEHALRPHDAFHTDHKGIEHDNPDNVGVFLGMVGAEVHYNGWQERVEIVGARKWPHWVSVSDSIISQLLTRAKQTGTRFKPAKDFLCDTLESIGQDNAADPVLDTFARLEAMWDSQPRLANWLSYCCGVPDDPYHRAVSRNIIGGMVRRVRKPGCKHDEMAVFCGFQGAGKSKLGKALALRDEWFTDSIMLGDESKELVRTLAGKMVCEISEMGSRHSDVNRIKAMLSKTHDYGRPAYGRMPVERARRNIFIGTTNDSKPLIDTTGNRRFLPIQVLREIDVDWVRLWIGQLIGEAAHLESAGATFEIPRDVWVSAKEKQEAARSESDIEIRLENWLAATEFTQNAYITAADLSQLVSMIGWRGNTSERGAIMKHLGFRTEVPNVGGKKTRVWYRGAPGMPGNIESASVRYEVDKTDKGLPKVTPRGPTCLPS